uniref:Uncharacterized protein n=1 Tax=Arundo donax TaxID=35708 RepID=A0A0A8Z8A5_ARUDO
MVMTVVTNYLITLALTPNSYFCRLCQIFRMFTFLVVNSLPLLSLA